MKNVVKRLWRDEEGQGMVEYALIIGMVSLVLIASFAALSGSFNTFVTKIGDKLAPATTPKP